MKFFLYIAVVISCGFLFGQDSFELGKKAYLDAKYENAVDYFESAIRNDSANVSAYYNLGMAHQQNGSYGKAIWAFEKVLKLSPSDDQAEDQILHCLMELRGEDVEWDSTNGPVMKVILSIGSFNWAVISMVISLLIALSIILSAIPTRLNRKGSYLLLISFGSMMIVTIILAQLSYSYETGHDYGIVTKKSIVTLLSDSGSDNGPELKEGSRLEIVDQSKNALIRVRDEDRNEYFIDRDDLDLI